MNSTALAIVLLVAIALLAWIVVRVFRGGAPTGESSARADTFATGSGYGAEDADTLRAKRDDERPRD